MVTQTHPVLSCTTAIEAALKDVSDVEPVFMSVADKKSALLGLSALVDQLEELRLRVLAVADDVAAQEGARDAAAWLAHRGRRDRGETRRRLRLAQGLDQRWPCLAQGLREGTVNLEQAETIGRGLDALPDDVEADLARRAEEHLVAQAARFGPRELRILARRVLDVVAPELADDRERQQLEREETRAARRTFLSTHRNGDGTTDIRMRVGDLVADRLLTYLESYTSPRRARSDEQSTGQAPDDRRPYGQRLGHAFAAFLEAVDPARLPLHGGDATAVFVTVDLATLHDGLGTALVGDSPVTAGEARRLACTAQIIPAVLGGASEVLDLGRSRRLFSPAQRRALALRDPSCRAEGCDIPAAWCEAHHAGQPWAQGGRTDLADGMLLCAFHHHRAHDRDYDAQRHSDGRVRFHRRS